jgi:hypothetical protein
MDTSVEDCAASEFLCVTPVVPRCGLGFCGKQHDATAISIALSTTSCLPVAENRLINLGKCNKHWLCNKYS